MLSNCLWFSTRKEIGNSQITKREYLKRKDRVKKTVSFILLGAGESGKSTILRQVINIFNDGFTDAYKARMKPFILHNVMEGCVYVIRHLQAHDQKSAQNLTLSNALLVLEKGATEMELNEEIVAVIQDCFNEAAFVKLAQSRDFYLLQDSWFTLASNIKAYPDWGGDEWLPSKEDILLSRIRTAEISDIYFQVNSYYYKMTDVPGQEAYRSKYLVQNYLKGVDVVLYVQSLSEYNLEMFEDEERKRFSDSFKLWTTIVNNNTLENSAFVLFFNKLDIFKLKYMELGIELPTKFTNFRPPPRIEDEEEGSCELALKWYKDLYLSRMRPSQRERVIVKYTTATDEDDMGPVIQQVSNKLVGKILAGRGFGG